MVNKRPSFQDAFKSALTSTDTGAKKQSTVSARRAAKPAPIAAAKKEAKAPEPAAKADVRTVKSSVYIPEPVHDQLIELQNLERKSKNRRVKIHDYIMEGIDRVFADRGLKSVAELVGKVEE